MRNVEIERCGRGGAALFCLSVDKGIMVGEKWQVTPRSCAKKGKKKIRMTENVNEKEYNEIYKFSFVIGDRIGDCK